jgi:hypothetical protein
MFQWRVILLAVLAVLLLVAGLLDGIALVLLILGCGVAWIAGILWHRRMYGS